MAKTFLSLNADFYYNSGSYGSPTWVLISNVKDLKLGLEDGEADVSTRGNGGWEAIVQALRKGSLEWGMVYDTTDSCWTYLQTAYMSRTSVEMACMDGPIATAGSQGLRATMAICKFEQDEALDGAIKNDVTAKPTYSANPPAWYTVS